MVFQGVAGLWASAGVRNHAGGGDTIMVNSGTYLESVESKRDGWSTTKPIALKAPVPGGAIIQPPADTNGFFISHNYHTIDGFRVAGAFQGLRLGPHDGGDGPVVGLLVQNNRINSNIDNGISVTNGLQHQDRVQHSKKQRPQRDQLLWQFQPDP